MAFSDSDRNFMQRALLLAQRAKGSTFPNPAVGAVIVNAEGGVVGEGATDFYGGPHAEKRALKKAGVAARGAAMYVTLEPCAHTGKTPPCADEIIKAGISRVIVAVKDPNPLVSGRGLRQLKEHGIDVQIGLLAKEAEFVNEDFFWAVAKKRPWVALKLAMTLDGRIADCQNGSKWITSPSARHEVQEVRRCHGAIAVGRNTLVSDNPRLTARCGKTYYPARIVFASGANIPRESYFWTHAYEARSIIVAAASCREETLPERGAVEYWYTGASDNAKSVDTFLDMAYAEGINSILVEGGQRLASSFLEAGLVNKLYLFYGNKIFGSGKDGLNFSKGLLVDKCISMKDVTHRSFGDNFLVTGYIR